VRVFAARQRPGHRQPGRLYVAATFEDQILRLTPSHADPFAIGTSEAGTPAGATTVALTNPSSVICACGRAGFGHDDLIVTEKTADRVSVLVPSDADPNTVRPRR